jgi:hypothetical protein
MSENPVLDNFHEQAEGSEKLGSPFVANLCRLLATTIDDSSAFGRRILGWPPETARADALALRACGALHALARSGAEPVLAAHYPPHPSDPEALRAAVKGAIARHDRFLTAYLDSPPQTNEVARSAILLGGMLTTARETGLPLEILEIGSSAGLNLMFDHYAYDLGNGRLWGTGEAPLTITCAWRGNAPALETGLRVVSRTGCDQNPLDPRSEKTVDRLLSYVWPDQPARMERLAVALGHAARAGTRIEKADAGDWLARSLAVPQRPGVARVLFHTIVWQYLPAAVKERAETAIAGGALRLTLWPGGEERLLGRADYHGRWVEWE